MPVMITENTSIDYDVHGEGPPLILIGGLGFGRWAFFKQIPALSRHFRTITFDVRGERDLKGGVSDLVADVVALLDHLRIRKAHVLGTSLGGFVAQELAIKRPDLVDRLVLVCTSYGRGGPQTMSPWALSDMIGLPALSVERAARRGLETATSEAYRARRPEEFEQIVSWRLADSPSLSAYYEQMRAGARFDASREVGSITSPTLVIHGAEDRYVPVANAAALAEAIPDAKLRVLDNAGHLVFIERFADVNREVVTFLKPRKPRKRREAQPVPTTSFWQRLVGHLLADRTGAVNSLRELLPCVNFSGLEVLPAENALEGLRGITCERVHFDLENSDTRGVRTLTSPHMTPAAHMIEYLVDASEKMKHDIAEPQAASRPPRWVALEPGKLVLEEAA